MYSIWCVLEGKRTKIFGSFFAIDEAVAWAVAWMVLHYPHNVDVWKGITELSVERDDK